MVKCVIKCECGCFISFAERQVKSLEEFSCPLCGNCFPEESSNKIKSVYALMEECKSVNETILHRAESLIPARFSRWSLLRKPNPHVPNQIPHTVKYFLYLAVCGVWHFNAKQSNNFLRHSILVCAKPLFYRIRIYPPLILHHCR